jgi:CelD/BcsL family acetyltransferase involved in cellulose biosynthesis
MSTESSSIGDWVNQLFDDIFYQSDDDKAIQAFETHVAPTMIAQ